MSTIVCGGRAISVITKCTREIPEPVAKHRYRMCRYSLTARCGRRVLSLGDYKDRQNIKTVLEDLRVIQETFNCNRSDATKLSLRLVADAIRAGRLTLGK
jgi:hypothetical protein